MPHEIDPIFPDDLALGASGGPQRRTDIITLGSGAEERNARWRQSRRRYNAGYGVRTLTDLQKIVQFFEGRCGRLYGFRFCDPLDHLSCLPGRHPEPTDQKIGTGDGQTARFQLVKHYGTGPDTYTRVITKPRAQSVVLAIDGTAAPPEHFILDATTGTITFLPAFIPPDGAALTAGFRFDIFMRFDTDYLEINLSHFQAGDIPEIPLVEITS